MDLYALAAKCFLLDICLSHCLVGEVYGFLFPPFRGEYATMKGETPLQTAFVC